MKDLLSNKGVGDWPFLNSDWKDCRLDIEWRMAKLNSMGLSSLFNLETEFGGDEHRLFAIVSNSNQNEKKKHFKIQFMIFFSQTYNSDRNYGSL